MRTTRCGGLLAIALGALAIAASAPIHAAAQADTNTPAGNKVAGQWRLSKPTGEPADSSTVPPDEPTGSEGRGGRRPGGGFGGGGYGGGRGGFGGGRGGDAIGGGSFSNDQMAAMRAAMREVSQSPNILNIVVSGDMVSFTTDQGVVRRYTADGKKEKIELGDVKVDCVTKWDQDTLTQEMKAGGVTITRTWQAVTDGQQLAITISTAGGQRRDGAGPQIRKVMYDRNVQTPGRTPGMIGGY